jgi:hypothetical protein
MLHPSVQTTCKIAMLMVCCFLQVKLLSSVAHGSADLSDKRRQELQDLENRWLRVQDDPAALESILAPDFLHVVPMGIITRDQQLDFMRKHPAPHANTKKHFEDMHVRIYDNVGIVNGVVVANEEGKTRRTLFSDVFAYRDGKWQAVNAQELPAKEQ